MSDHSSNLPLDLDEFDSIPDDFLGIDFDSVPELSQYPALSTHAPLNDTEPGPARSQDQVVGSSSPPHVLNPNPASGRSSEYSFDDLNESVLREVDEIDQFFLGETPQRSNTGNGVLSQSTAAECEVISRPHKRRPSVSPDPAASTSTSPRKKHRTRPSLSVNDSLAGAHDSRHKLKKGKGKKKSKTRDQAKGRVKAVLEKFEDDLTCPICCDIFASAFVGVPCGHSYCGECAWNWISTNITKPTCPTCRAELLAKTPIVASVTINNIIERHVTELAASGATEWKKKGAKFKDWNTRKRSWKKLVQEQLWDYLKNPRGRSQYFVKSIAQNVNLGTYDDLHKGCDDEEEDEEDESEYAESSNDSTSSSSCTSSDGDYDGRPSSPESEVSIYEMYEM